MYQSMTDRALAKRLAPKGAIPPKNHPSFGAKPLTKETGAQIGALAGPDLGCGESVG